MGVRFLPTLCLGSSAGFPSPPSPRPVVLLQADIGLHTTHTALPNAVNKSGSLPCSVVQRQRQGALFMDHDRLPVHCPLNPGANDLRSLSLPRFTEKTEAESTGENLPSHTVSEGGSRCPAQDDCSRVLRTARPHCLWLLLPDVRSPFSQASCNAGADDLCLSSMELP